MNDFLAQYGSWTLRHALYHPPHHYLDLFRSVPCLWGLALFGRSFRSGVLTICLFLSVYLLVPISRYCLPAIPLVCLLAVDGYRRLSENTEIFPFKIILAISFLFLLRPITADLVRPWRKHPYGIQDTRYIAEKLTGIPLPRPIWTNYPDLYLVEDWPVPVNDFYDMAEVPGSVIDWGKPPFSQIETRVELLPTDTAMGHEPTEIQGWKTFIIPLERGKFTTLRVRIRE